MPADNLQTYKVSSNELSSSTKQNNMVQAIEDALNSLDNANIAAAAAILVSKLAAGSNDQILRTDAGVPTWAKLINANVDTAAAIAVSKLAAGSNGQVLQTTGGVPTWGAASGAIGYATTLPGSPANGDMTILVDSTSSPSYHWLLRYNSTETDWDFIGGAPGFDEVTADQTTSSTSYTDLSTTGPSFALPVAGDYDIAIGFSRGATDNAADQIFMSYAIGGTAAVDADAVMGSGQTARFSPMRVRRKTGLTAVTLTAKYRSVAAAAESFANRWISVTPKRLTP